MRLLFRYVLRQAAATTTLIVLALTVVVWIALALRQLNLVTTQGQDTLAFLTITLLGLPGLMAVVAPVALLIGVIQVLYRLGSDSELIVMNAAGATVWTVARPLLVLASVVSALVFTFNLLVVPWSNQALRRAITEVRTDLIAQVVQPGRFTSPERGLTFHVRDRSASGELLGLLMHDGRDDKQAMTFLAERARIVKQGGESYLMMQQGHILRRPAGDEVAQIIAFDSYGVDLARFEPRLAQRVLAPRERTLEQLLAPTAQDLEVPRMRGLIRSELHERFASALYPFTFTLLALALVGTATTTRQGRGKALAATFVIATVVRVAGLATTNLVALRASAVPLLYAIPIATAALAAVVANWRMRPRPVPAAVQRLAEGWRRVRVGLGAHVPVFRRRQGRGAVSG